LKTISRLVELGLWRISELTFGVGTTTPRERSSSGCATTVIISVRETCRRVSQCNIAHIPLMEPHFGLAHPDSPGASFEKRPGWGIEQAINFEEPGAAPAERECSAGYFL